MDSVCAILDCQGFQFKDRFVPREIAIVSDKISQCQELNPHMNWRELSEEDQAVVLHSTKFKHGLHYCPFNPVEHCFLYDSTEVGKIIEAWYALISTDEKPAFAYKNQQLKKIIEDLGIPSIDLESPSLGFPSYDQLKTKYGDNYLCSYHKKPIKNSNHKLICAYRKANHLYRYMKEMQNQNLDWNSM